MADKPIDVVIHADKLGLPPDATPEQILKRIYDLQESAAKFEKMQNEADRLLAKAEEGEKAKAELAKVEARLVIERAVANQWIDKSQADFYAEMYAREPEKVKKHLEDMKFRSFLARADRLSTTDLEKSKASPLAEVQGRVAELRAKDANLSESAAMSKVFEDNPKLYEAYRATVLAGKGAE